MFPKTHLLQNLQAFYGRYNVRTQLLAERDFTHVGLNINEMANHVIWRVVQGYQVCLGEVSWVLSI